MTVNIHQGCSLEAMKSMKDNQYDLAVVDPPYGIGITGDIHPNIVNGPTPDWSNPRGKEYTQKEWDTQAPPLEYFQEVCRVSSNQIVWGGQYFTDKLPVSGGWIVWDKGVSMPTLGKAELAWTSMKNSVQMVRLLWAGYRKCEVTDRIHPTQKPVALYHWIYEKYASPGMKILDTHLGSGSSAIAAWDCGLDFDGWELDVEYYAGAVSRYQEHISLLKLF